ncbi:MAG TPA: endonuclease domain-containing protein [Luteimonas sp.]|nr:endonuclease domain-containing protein [Luteimonas sp.]
MQGQTNRKILGGKLQRKLRKTPTDAEMLLWRHLRGRQLEGCKFRRQHPLLDFVVDFTCLERRIVVELDGGQHADAEHYDTRRTATLEKAGFAVLRFWNNEVFENIDGVLEVILQTLLQRATPSPPNPPLEGEG